MRRPLFLTACSILAICVPAATLGESRKSPVDPWATLESEIRARGIDPESIEIPGRLSEEMKLWVHDRISPDLSSDTILRRVLEELIDPGGFKLIYDSSFTGTAEQVWTTRRANCLGFTHLYVGLTRELGLPTYYVRWSSVERFRREGDLILVSGHVSAGYGTASQRRVLEFGAVDGFEGQLSRPISDLNAVSRHYANRSAELLRAGDYGAAVEAADLATRLDPSLADAWVNLGVSRRRFGDPLGAKDAYRRATLEDPDHLPAYQNLSVLLYLQGADNAARETMELLDRRDNRNPFIYLALGDTSLNLGRLEEAERYYQRAHRLESALAETRAARGMVAFLMGDQEKARKWLRRAQAVDPEDERTVELADILSRSREPSK